MKATDPYRTVAAESRYEGPKIKGSRFIATVAPIRDAGEVGPLLVRLRREFPEANHHCHAWRLGPDGTAFRYSDDGEPSGTGGRPILQRIERQELTDTVVVVSRVFGGTKLGAGGLIRAYGGAAGQALQQAKIREVVPVRRVTLTFPYELLGTVQGALTAAGLTAVEREFAESVALRLEIPAVEAEDFLTRLNETASGRVRIDESTSPCS